MEKENIIRRLKDLLADYCTYLSISVRQRNVADLFFSELFVQEILNELLHTDFLLANNIKTSYLGADLVDIHNKIGIEISISVTAMKIRHSLSAFERSMGQEGWHFRIFFLTMADDHVDRLRKRQDLQNKVCSFDPAADILDFSWVIQQVQNLDSSAQKDFYEKCRSMLDATHFTNPIPHCLTELPPAAAEWMLPSRRDDAAAIKSRLESGRNHLLINGPAGIGKTELARVLFYDLKDSYAHVAWIRACGQLEHDLIEGFTYPQAADGKSTSFQKICDLLGNGSRKLLIIDSLDSLDEENILSSLLHIPDLDMIVTSQQQSVDGFESYTLLLPTMDECRQLFCQHSECPEGQEQDAVDQLIRELGNSPLLVAMIAKTLSPNSSIQVNLEKLLWILRSSKNNLEEALEELQGNLLNNFSAKEIKILQNMAVMPDMPIPGEIMQLIGAEQQVLTSLDEHGWLLCDQEKNTFRIHGLIRDIMIRDGIPENIGIEIAAAIEENRYFVEDETYLTLQPKLEIAWTVLQRLEPDYKQDRNAWYALGEKLYDQGKYKKALFCFERCVLSSLVAGTEMTLDAAAAYSGSALALLKIGHTDKALERGEKAFAIYVQNGSSGNTASAKCCYTLGLIYSAMGRYADSERYIRKYQEISKNALDQEQPHTAVVYSNLASLYCENGKFTSALEYSLKAQVLCERQFGTMHPETAANYELTGRIYRKLNKLNEALEYSLKALEIREKVLGPEHPETAECCNNIAKIYLAKGDFKTAEIYSLKDIAVCEKTLGVNHPDTTDGYCVLAEIYQKQGRLKEALAYSEKSLDNRKTAFCPELSDVVSNYLQIIGICIEMSETKIALVYLEQLLDCLPGTGNFPDLERSRIYLTASELHNALGNQEESIKYVDLAKEAAGTDMESTELGARIFHQSAVCLMSQYRYEEAEEAARKALEIQTRLQSNSLEIARNMHMLGNISIRTSQYAAAISWLQGAEALYTNANANRNDLAHCYEDQGVAHMQLSQLNDALTCFQKAMQLSGDKKLLLPMGTTLSLLGRHSEAMQKLQEGVAYFDKTEPANAKEASAFRLQKQMFVRSIRTVQAAASKEGRK